MTSPIILSAICIGLVFLQRDVGQTLLILIIFSQSYFMQVLAFKIAKIWFNCSYRCCTYWWLILLIGLVPDYLTARFSTLTDPFSNEGGTGYHISNSLIAIGNGGLLGRGLGNSIMKLGYLPEPHTDFIFYYL